MYFSDCVARFDKQGTQLVNHVYGEKDDKKSKWIATWGNHCSQYEYCHDGMSSVLPEISSMEQPESR